MIASLMAATDDLVKAAGEDLTLEQLLQALEPYHTIRHITPGTCRFCAARAKAELLAGFTADVERDQS
jgi:hypothetical protein